MAILTVSIDEQQLARAIQVAASSGLSVEAYVSKLIDVVMQHPPLKHELGPLTQSLAGALQPMSDEDVERAIFEHRNEKYGEGLNLRFRPSGSESIDQVD